MKHFHKRKISKKLSHLSTLYPAILVSGPRQTGKTELVKRHFPDHKWILLDNALLSEEANNDPNLFLQNNSPPFILDEIQKAPKLFPAIKDYIDRNKPEFGNIILTGSQPLQLMNLVSESLAGRIGLLELLPMTPSELFETKTYEFSFNDWIKNPPIGEVFKWKIPPYEFLLRGGFPRMGLRDQSPSVSDSSIRLNDYIQTYLSKDLRDLSSINDLGRFERFLRTLSTSSGKITELSALARQADLPQGTAHDWLSILQASLIYWSVQGYSGNKNKRERKRPKGFLIDSGLTCNLLNVSSSESLQNNPLTGFIMETAVANCIRSLLYNSSTSTPPLFYWNYKNEQEVDLVVEGELNALYPIEIKATGTPAKSYPGLDAFSQRYSDQVSLRMVITTNERCYWIDENTLHIPLSAL
ncbi:MAG: ATP-binding protein [Bdellovibrionota bacterium]